MKHKKGSAHNPYMKSAPSKTGGGGGSNLKFKNTTQAVHVEGQPDHMAHNVGGSSAHMSAEGNHPFGKDVTIMKSGGGMKAQKVKERY